MLFIPNQPFTGILGNLISSRHLDSFTRTHFNAVPTKDASSEINDIFSGYFLLSGSAAASIVNAVGRAHRGAEHARDTFDFPRSMPWQKVPTSPSFARQATFRPGTA